MPALVAGIHVFSVIKRKKDVDGRNKSGHDDLGAAIAKAPRASLSA
jgi:D-alanyl-D-alanine dipeptidase